MAKHKKTKTAKTRKARTKNQVGKPRKYCKTSITAKSNYSAPNEQRKKQTILLPFWDTIAKSQMLFNSLSEKNSAVKLKCIDAILLEENQNVKEFWDIFYYYVVPLLLHLRDNYTWEIDEAIGIAEEIISLGLEKYEMAFDNDIVTMLFNENIVFVIPFFPIYLKPIRDNIIAFAKGKLPYFSGIAPTMYMKHFEENIGKKNKSSKQYVYPIVKMKKY